MDATLKVEPIDATTDLGLLYIITMKPYGFQHLAYGLAPNPTTLEEPSIWFRANVGLP
jgi:hypothetical protein